MTSELAIVVTGAILALAAGCSEADSDPHSGGGARAGAGGRATTPSGGKAGSGGGDGGVGSDGPDGEGGKGGRHSGGGGSPVAGSAGVGGARLGAAGATAGGSSAAGSPSSSNDAGAGGAGGFGPLAGMSGAAGSGAANLPPIPVLFYEIDLNEWVPVHEGDTVIRGLDQDINWGACSSYDPDGSVVRIVLNDGLTTQILRPGGLCIQEHTETNHDPRDLTATLVVEDDESAQAVLRFTYRTE